MKPLREPVPAERAASIRRQLVLRLVGPAASARELSADLGIREKDVCVHLEHIRRSLHGQVRHLVIQPACCQSCGFEFSKRQRLQRPGRCPRCRATTLSEPRFSIRNR